MSFQVIAEIISLGARTEQEVYETLHNIWIGLGYPVESARAGL